MCFFVLCVWEIKKVKDIKDNLSEGRRRVGGRSRPKRTSPLTPLLIKERGIKIYSERKGKVKNSIVRV